MKAIVKTVFVAAAVLALLPGLAWAVPTANNQSLTVPPNLAAPGRLIYLSYSGASGTVTFTVNKPAHGTLTSYGTSYPQYYYYLPNAGYQGPDPFTWKVTDSTGTSNLATYSITVANTVPVANPQAVSVSENVVRQQFYLSFSDPDAQPMTFTLVSAPAHGNLEAYVSEYGYYVWKNVTVGVPMAGSFNYRWYYTAQAGYTGSDPFTWKLNDGMADSNVATCTVNVNVNTPPTANNTSASVSCGTRSLVPLMVTDPDLGQLRTFTRVSGPSHGTVEMPAPTTSTYAYAYYTSANDYVGPDSFQWKVNDGSADSNTATVTITVNGVPPVPQDQTAAVKNTTAVDIRPLYTGGGYTLVFVKETSPSPSAGTVTVVGDKFRFVPVAGYTGMTSFKWHITYSNATTPATNTASATCTVHVMDDSGTQDWPQWRADEHRSAVSVNDLPSSLYLQWRRDMPTASVVTGFKGNDIYSRPVQLGKTIFANVAASDSIEAYDTDTGTRKWAFYASGATSRPPVAMRLASGKEVVIFGSDDGYVYCVNAATGTLEWKFQGAPNKRLAMGFGRLGSPWPIFGSPVVSDGKVYFTAGYVSLTGGLYAYCLDAATGSVVWRNDGRLSDTWRNSSRQPLTVSYDHTKIYGVNGFIEAWALDLATGEMAGLGGLPDGGWHNRAICTWVDGSGQPQDDTSSPRFGEMEHPPAPQVITICSRTLTPTDAAALGVVGTVSTMLAGDNKLFITTTQGSIYCFGGTQVTAKTYPVSPTPLPAVSDGWTTLAGSILSREDLKQGLALVWGVGSGRLVEELAKQGGAGLSVVAVDPDPAKLRALRVKMDGAGWSGARVSTFEGNPMDFGFAPYQAVIIASEDASVAGIGGGSAMLKKMYKSLRPFGGEAWIPTTDAQHASISSWATSLGLPLCTVARKTGFAGAGAGTFTQVARTGLPDSEQIPKPPYGIIAFGVVRTLPATAAQKGVKDGRDIYSDLPFTVAGGMPGYEPPAPAENNVDARRTLPSVMMNPLYSRMEASPATGRYVNGCQGGPAVYGSLQLDRSQTCMNLWDSANYAGTLMIPEFSSCYSMTGYWGKPSMVAGNGVVAFAGSGLHMGPGTLIPMMGILASVEDQENTMSYRFDRSSVTIEETPVKHVGVNLGGSVGGYEDDTVWTHHPAALRANECDELPIPVTYRGDVARKYHHSAQMEPFGNSPKGWVYASNVSVMDGISVHLMQPVVARSGYSAPVVDGSLGDSCWDGANRLNIAVAYEKIPGVGDFLNVHHVGDTSWPKEDDHAYAMLRYDNVNLYVGAGLHIPSLSMSQNFKSVKLALADRENPDQLVVLSCDAAGGKSSTGLDVGLWTCATRTDGADPFTVEFAIPWSALEAAGIWKEQMLIDIDICGQRLTTLDNKAAVGAQLTPLYLDAARGVATVAKPHTVKLYFAEMEGLSAGQRSFDVKLQGQTVLSNLDVVAQAGGGRRGLLKEFANVMIADKLDVDFTRKVGIPMLSGVEIVGTYADPANVSPVAQIAASPASGAAPLSVSFSARKSYDPDGQITTCLWSFGDGATGQGSLTSHVYSEPGTYVARLTVVDDRGGTGEAGFTVTVGSGSVAAFVCKIRASGGDYTTLTAWETAIESDLTAAGSLLFPVSSRGSYAAADDGTAVTFTGGGTGTLKHINTVNVAYVTGCTGTIQSGTVTCASGRTFSVSGTGSRIALAVAEGYNDWPATGLADKLTLSGWITDKDHAVAIRPATGQGHAGVLKDASGQYAGFTVNAGTGTGISDGIGNVRVEGVIVLGKVKLGAGSSANRVISCNGMVSVGIGGVVSNCMGIGSGFAAVDSLKCLNNATIINCTSVNAAKAFATGLANRQVRFVNCLAKPAAGGMGFDNSQYPLLNAISYCASSDGTADDWDNYPNGGGNNRVNQTFSFVNAAQNDFRLAASDTGAQGWGTAGLGADIEGQERTAPFDIGADEVSGGGAPVAPVITSPLTASGTVGQPFSYTITASGTAPITFGASGLPAGLSRSGAVISGTPMAAGTQSVTLTATNSAGTDTKTLVITVVAANSSPVISGFSPESPTGVAAGTSQPFTIDAWDADGDPITYVWKLDGGTVGVTGSVFTYSPVATDAGAHSIEVTVSDGRGGSVKQTWSVTVTVPATPPSITAQPVSKTVTVGATATFSMVATGTVPLSYQWQKNGANISGATSASYTTAATTLADNGAKFRATVTNSAGSATSSEATLTVNKATPTITWATPVAITYGTALSGTQLNATASVPGVFIYTPGAGTVLAVGSHTLTADFTPTDTASYNTASKSVTLVVNSAAVAPSITTQPASTTVTAGQTATFSVAATGTAPLSYQWQKNGANISGAISASYTTAATTTADSGSKFKVTVTNAAGSVTSSEATLTVNPAPADLPVVTLTAYDAWAAEPSSDTGRFRLYRSNCTTTAALTVKYTMSGSATNGSDYQSLTGSVTIAAGSRTAYVYVTPKDDTLVEGAESVTMTLSADAAYVPGSPDSATVALLDNETPIITVSAGDAYASEPGGDTGSFRVARGGSTTAAVTVKYTVAGTAAGGADYQTLTGSVVVPPGKTSAYVYVTALDDSLTEDLETVVLTVSEDASYQVGKTSVATVNLLDDEMPILTVKATDAVAAEPSDAGTFTVTRSGKLNVALTVSYKMSGIAKSGTDYVAPSGTVTLASGVTTATVTISPIDDTAAEGRESVTLVLVDGSAFQLGSPSSATLYVYDDEKPYVSITASDSKAYEAGLDPGEFAVSCVPAAKAATTVGLTITGTATPGSDYQALPNSVTIAAGASSAKIAVKPLDDAASEVSESVRAALAAGATYQVGTPSSAAVYITSNE